MDFYGGVYLGFLGGVVSMVVSGLFVIASWGLLKKKEKALTINIIGSGTVLNPGKEFSCPSMNIKISEEACKFHRAMCPEACVNCLIPQGEAA